jgi:hypothetical protein
MEPLFDLEGRTIPIGGVMSIESVLDALLRMNASPKRWKTPITIYLGIGGERWRGLHAMEAMQICSLIRCLRSEVTTIGLGFIYEYDAIVLASGKPGKRHLLPHTLISLGELDVDYVPLPNVGIGLLNENQTPSLVAQAKQLVAAQIHELTTELGLSRKVWGHPRIITASQAIELGLADVLVPVAARQLLLTLNKTDETIPIPAQS